MQKEPLILALAAVAAAGTASAAPPAAAPLQVDQQVRGEITSADAINYRDGTRSKLYRIDLESGQGVNFRVEGALRAHLSLFAEDQLLQSSSDRGEVASLSVRAPQPGRYLLAVSGRDAAAYGPYTLKVDSLQLYDGGVVRPGASITDWSETAREIPLQVERAGLYAIRMSSDEFDTLLRLEGNGVSLSNDDAEGTNSLITARLEPGRYTVRAGGYNDSIKGQYRLSVEERTLPAGTTLADGGSLTAGETLTGLHEGQPLSYRLEVPARRMVTLTMRSSEFDSMLELQGGGMSLSDDDSGGGLDARIATVLEPGEYTVRAAAVGEGAGLFTLEYALAEVPEGAGGGTLTVGQERDAQLVPGLTDRYTVEIRRAGAHTIEMGSDAVDSHLRLLRDGEVVATDDDGGGGLNAKIEQNLAPGTYVIEAGSAVGPQGGAYRIGIRRR